MNATQQTQLVLDILLDMSTLMSNNFSEPEKKLKTAERSETPPPANIDILTKLSIPLREQTDADMSNMSTCPTNVQQLTPCQLTLIAIHAWTSPAVNPESRGVIPKIAWLAYCQQCELKKPFTDYDTREEWIRIHRFNNPDHRTMTGAGKV